MYDKIHEIECSIKEVFNMALDSCMRIEGYRRNGLWRRYGDVLFEKDPVELINNICAYTNKVFTDNDFELKFHKE